MQDAAHALFERKTCTIVVIDLVESVRLIEEHEESTVTSWLSFVQMVQGQLLVAHNGRMVKSLGDGLMLEFANSLDGVACAHALQREAAVRSLLLRAGVHVAEVLANAMDIFGKGPNLAARLASLAEPGECVVSAELRDALTDGLDAHVYDMGDCYLKHLKQPVRAFRLAPVTPSQPIAIAQITPAASPTDADADADESPLQARLAVLNFTATLPSDTAAIGHLIADGLISRLSQVPQLAVISRLSTAALGQRQLDLAQTAALLGASFIFSGSFYEHAGTICITAELADVRSNAVIWLSREQCTLSDLLAPESVCLHGMAQAATQALYESQTSRAARQPLPTLDAFSLLTGAVNIMHRQSFHEFDRARLMLEHLSERYPRIATPRACLAQWYSFKLGQGWATDVQSDTSRSLHQLDRAHAAEPRHSLAWTVRGLIEGYVNKNFSAAQDAYAEALASNPSEALAWLYSATLHAWRGEGEQAVTAAHKALLLAPLDPMRYYYESLAATAFMSGGNYQDARRAALASARTNCTHSSTYRVLAISNSLLGDGAAAAQAIERLSTLSPGYSVQQFLSTSPIAQSPQAELFAQALTDAGLPVQ